MIPIYRAKKIDSDDWVEGYFIGNVISENNIGILKMIVEVDTHASHKIDPSTLAIHFPNMLDKNGKKIFASLDEIVDNYTKTKKGWSR